MKINSNFRMSRRSLVLIGAAAILGWLVVSRSLNAYLADAAPSVASWIDPGQPEALLNLADQALERAATGQDIADASGRRPRPEQSLSGDGATRLTQAAISNGAVDRAFSRFESIGENRSISRPLPPDNVSTVREWAESAIRSEPVNAQAFQALGRLAEAQGDDEAAFKFLRAAERLSLHQGFATFWLLRASTHAHDYASAVRYADVLLRTNLQSYRYVVPFLAEIIQNKGGSALVEKVLATDPPWRAEFIADLPYDVTDARTPLNLLLALRTDPKPPKMSDLVPYLDFLVQHKLYALAYYTWLQFLSTDELRHAGYLFNGAFEDAPSGAPFDWKITQGTGITVDIVPRPDHAGQRALMLDFEFGRVDYHSVAELVVLHPGTYQFNGEYQGQLIGPRGLKWRVTCADGAATPAGESPMISGTTKGWKNVTFTFTVPDKDCSAQYVRLDLDARMASEELVSGTIFFDQLQISRVAQPSTAGG
jgi:tetratricopeptide (TPR) repeat protein